MFVQIRMDEMKEVLDIEEHFDLQGVATDPLCAMYLNPKQRGVMFLLKSLFKQSQFLCEYLSEIFYHVHRHCII